jgi:hypothetical protein
MPDTIAILLIGIGLIPALALENRRGGGDIGLRKNSGDRNISAHRKTAETQR